MVFPVCLQSRDISAASENYKQPLVIGNPADNMMTDSGLITFYIPEFSRPTGRYINKILLQILNRIVRNGSVAVAGNPCTPGLGLMGELTVDTAKSIINKSKQRTVIVNCKQFQTGINGISFAAEPFMKLALPVKWKTLDDYISAMHSKYRVRVKKAITESSVLQSSTYRGRGIPATLFPVLAELLSQTLAKKTIALPSNLSQLLKAFANQFGNDFEVQVYEFDNRPVGFLSRVYLSSGVYGMHIGYNGQHARQWHLYQRMMIDLIEKSIHSGAETVHLGRTATEIKSTLGAEPEENYFVLISRNPLIRAAAVIYKKLFFKPAAFIIRQPFKV